MSEQIKIRAFLEGAADWRVVSDGAVAFYANDSLATSAQLVSALAAIDGLADHNFAIDVRPDGVSVRIVTLRDDYMGMTTDDLRLATEISAAAANLGLRADPSQIQSLLVIPGAPNRAEIMPFWQAVMGYVPRPDSPAEDLIDPHDRNSAIWVEEMDEARPGNFLSSTVGSEAWNSRDLKSRPH